MSDIHYIFRDGKTYAIREGKVVAAHEDADQVERQVKQAFGEPYGEVGYGGRGEPLSGGVPESDFIEPTAECPHCGNPNVHGPICEHCGAPVDGVAPNPEDYPQDMPSPGIEMGGEAGPYMAKVTTPNGLKGTVLGKVAGLWGDEVTIRLENGRIVKLPVGTELKGAQKTAGRKSPVDVLESRLARVADGTRESLVTRSEELDTLQRHARSLIAEASWENQKRLDAIIVTADVEQREIADAVAHLDSVDSIQAPGFSMAAAHSTAGVSREDGSWLDDAYNQMIKQAEATDYTKLMDEGPEALAAELENSALTDQEVTHQIASHFIAEKTAGVDRKIANPYMETFLARVEQCRQAELTRRAEEVKTQTKEASVQEDPFKDLPDDAIFLS